MKAVPAPARCFAPDVFRHSTPERVAFGTVPVPFGIVQKPFSLHVSREPRGSLQVRIEDKQMSADTLELEGRVRRITGRESRSQSIATRFTRAEVSALAKKAEANGQNLREWARGALLRELREEQPHFDLVCEVVGLQLLLMNLLAPLARGERISAEQFQGIVRSVQSTKVKAAQEMLSRRRESKEG
jgi:hypothetical protein